MADEPSPMSRIERPPQCGWQYLGQLNSTFGFQTFYFKEYKMDKFLSAAKQFSSDEEGAQVIEYALIIAVVSIILVVALRNLTGTSFEGFITRVNTCLTTSASCA